MNETQPESGTRPEVRVAQPQGQPTNRNFLTPSGFTFQVQRALKVTYYGNLVTLPGLNLPHVVQNTYLKEVPYPGDVLEFEDLRLRFLVDTNLENYMEIQNWLRGLGFPESLQEIYDLQWKKSPYDNGQPERSQLNLYSDGTLTILDQLNNPKFKVLFKDLFPISLTTLTFDATLQSQEFFTAEVAFKYSIYEIREIDCSKC